MNIAIVHPFILLLLTISAVPHLPTIAHDRMGYGPTVDDVQFVSSGVLVLGEDIAIPIEWNAGEQLLWVAEEAWDLIPEETLLSLSGEVAGELGLMVL